MFFVPAKKAKASVASAARAAESAAAVKSAVSNANKCRVHGCGKVSGDGLTLVCRRTV